MRFLPYSVDTATVTMRSTFNMSNFKISFMMNLPMMQCRILKDQVWNLVFQGHRSYVRILGVEVVNDCCPSVQPARVGHHQPEKTMNRFLSLYPEENVFLRVILNISCNCLELVN